MPNPQRPLNMRLLWPCTLRLSAFSAILFCAVTGVGISTQVGGGKSERQGTRAERDVSSEKHL